MSCFKFRGPCISSEPFRYQPEWTTETQKRIAVGFHCWHQLVAMGTHAMILLFPWQSECLPDKIIFYYLLSLCLIGKYSIAMFASWCPCCWSPHPYTSQLFWFGCKKTPHLSFKIVDHPERFQNPPFLMVDLPHLSSWPHIPDSKDLPGCPWNLKIPRWVWAEMRYTPKLSFGKRNQNKSETMKTCWGMYPLAIKHGNGKSLSYKSLYHPNSQKKKNSSPISQPVTFDDRGGLPIFGPPTLISPCLGGPELYRGFAMGCWKHLRAILMKTMWNPGISHERK